MSDTMTALAPVLGSALGGLEVIVCCGSGGVGKTTVSASLALALAVEEEKRVLVLTVDPARRLANALGLTHIGTDPVAIPRQRLRRAGLAPRGELVAAMLDMKSTWDRMIERHAPSRESARRILGNRFYKTISDAFIGSHEYAAMEELYELHAGKEYDCVVIDTPPSRNALDFLEAPQRLSDFVGARLLQWLAPPTRFGWRAFNLAATPFLRLADRLVGADVVRELAEFVPELQGLYRGVRMRATEVYRLLRSSSVGFVVVTTLEQDPFSEAEFFCNELHEFSMPLRGIVANRTLPDYLCDPAAASAAVALSEDETISGWLSDELGHRVTNDAARRLGETFLVFHRLARRDAAQLDRLSRLTKRVPVARIPLMTEEVGDLEGLARVARYL